MAEEFDFRKYSRRGSGGGGAGRSPGSIVALVVALGVAGYFGYTMFRIEVGTGEMAILMHKTGLDLSNDMEIAPSEEYKGVQTEVLTEGRHWRNPYHWSWEVIPQFEVPKGQVGVLVSLVGDDLGYGEFLAKSDDQNNVITKGIVPEVLRPGRYAVNPYVFQLELHPPVTIPAGYKGVVTNLAGAFPKTPNTLLVNEGERGVQESTLDPRTYYINPYVTRISLVDVRNQRFNLAENKDMGFPSKDGFWVSLDGIIEFHVNPEKAAEVFVTYNEDFNGDQIDEEIISKIIMPNARAFCRLEGSNKLGHDFIQGSTRADFQDKFKVAMQKACEPLGVNIVQALITRIHPPQPIAEPVRERELSKQEEMKYQQQIIQQEEERQLATKKALVKQKSALVAIEQDIVKVVVQAEREQEVAVTQANERQQVAQFALEAAKDQAAAILATGKAEADVIGFENEADAAGWRAAVMAFGGNGKLYAQYMMYQKMASAYRQLMINTADSPIMRIFDSFTRPESGPTGSLPADTATGRSTQSSPSSEKRAVPVGETTN